MPEFLYIGSRIIFRYYVNIFIRHKYTYICTICYQSCVINSMKHYQVVLTTCGTFNLCQYSSLPPLAWM